VKQLEVQIMGQSYLLGCPEGGEPQLLEAVGKVDAAMCKIRDAGKVRARDRIAVLAALNVAFEQPVATVPVQARAANSSASGPVEGDDLQVVSRLIADIDSVLGEDGQLL
jgi:cell division protein ZapA